MRLFITISVFLLSVASPVRAQTPTSQDLDSLLNKWEARMSKMQTFRSKCDRIDLDPLRRKPVRYSGEVAFKKPGMARLDLTEESEVKLPDDKKTKFERMFCSQKHFIEYNPIDKLIIVRELPKNESMDDSMVLSLLKGMKAEDAKKRFGLTLTKKDDYYAYIYITPKLDADRKDFGAAQLVLWVKNPNPATKPNCEMMPCRLWYKDVSGKEVTYNFTETEPDINLPADYFAARQIPGYQVKHIQQAKTPAANPPKPPSTVRQQNP